MLTGKAFFPEGGAYCVLAHDVKVTVSSASLPAQLAPMEGGVMCQAEIKCRFDGLQNPD